MHTDNIYEMIRKMDDSEISSKVDNIPVEEIPSDEVTKILYDRCQCADLGIDYCELEKSDVNRARYFVYLSLK